MERAIDERVGGIAVSLIDPDAFNGPTALALQRGIPVVSYNADGGKANARLAYIGQDNYQSGLELGARIVSLVAGGEVFLFIATPGQENIQPRIDGALDAIRDSGKHDQRPGGRERRRRRGREDEDRADLPREPDPAWTVRGRRRLDRRGRRGDARARAPRPRRAGRRVRPPARRRSRRSPTATSTSRSTSSPTCRGSCPFCSSSSTATASGLVAPADTNTGVNFVTRANVAPYLTTRSRYEGSSSRESLPGRPQIAATRLRQSLETCTIAIGE